MNAVFPVLKENKATLAQLAVLVKLDPRVFKDLSDLRVVAEKRELRVIRVSWAHLDVLENRVPQEHKDHLGLLALPVCLVSRDNLVTTVALVMPALLASRARQDWKDRRVIKVTKDPRVPSAKQVLWVRQEIVACPDFQDLSALLALEDYEGRREKVDQLVDLEMRVQLGLWVCRVHLDRMDPPANLVQRGPQAKKVLLVFLDVPETRDPPVPLDLLDHLDRWVNREYRDKWDPPAQLENEVQLVKLDLWESKAQLDHEANQAHPDLKENEENEVKSAVKVLKVIAVLSAFKVFLVPLVLWATRVRLALKVILVNQESQVLKVRLVETVLLGRKVLWAHLDHAVMLERRVRAVLRVRPVPPDLPDLLASLWATMLPHWQPF